MNDKAKSYLKQFLSSLTPEDSGRYKTFDAYHYCADEQNANLCAELVLAGEKRATAGLLWAYEAEGEPVPEVGQLSVITNWVGIPQCIVETTAVEIRSFSEVDETFAFEEGEGDKSLTFWKRVHWDFFKMECEAIGKEPSDKMPVILEWFKMVYKG